MSQLDRIEREEIYFIEGRKFVRLMKDGKETWVLSNGQCPEPDLELLLKIAVRTLAPNLVKETFHLFTRSKELNGDEKWRYNVMHEDKPPVLEVYKIADTEFTALSDSYGVFCWLGQDGEPTDETTACLLYTAHRTGEITPVMNEKGDPKMKTKTKTITTRRIDLTEREMVWLGSIAYAGMSPDSLIKAVRLTAAGNTPPTIEEAHEFLDNICDACEVS